MVAAYIGLGSNLDNPQQQILQAQKHLALLDVTFVTAISSLYISKPMDDSDQPYYYNAVARIDTDLQPLALLSGLQAIENKQLRKREQHWGPRTLDLDLLLYGEDIISIPSLQVPHPGIALRDFVLWPLFELSPELLVPGLGRVQQLFEVLADTGIKKL